MEIASTRDLRKFLADVMVDVRSGKVKAQDAQAIAKLSAQINQSLSIECNMAIRQGLKPGDAIETEALSISGGDNSISGEAWCEQCDARVPLSEARDCKSPYCSLKQAA